MFIAVISYVSYKVAPDLDAGFISESNYPGAIGLIIGLLLSTFLVVIEVVFSRKFIGIFSTLAVALILGFVISKLILMALYLVPAVESLRYGGHGSTFEGTVVLCVTFLCVIVILKTKDEFKFVLPYVEFRKQRTFGRPILLDTSAIIDGRILNILDTKIMDCEIIIPRFVLEELQKLADSHDKLKRSKGRRGLDILNKLKEHKDAAISIPEIMLPDVEGVDNKLMELSKATGSRIMTNDFQLEKVAQIQGMDVVNLNSLTKAVQLAIVQGDRLSLEIIRKGEGPGQGVGFLPDGTMVVGEGCENRIGKTIDLVVKNIIQTTAGRIVFCEPAYEYRRS